VGSDARCRPVRRRGGVIATLDVDQPAVAALPPLA
jgi:hypothetical protein